MTARTPSRRSVPAAATAAGTDQPALNRAERRARRTGGNQPQRTIPGASSTRSGSVSTKPAHHRTDFAARRSG
ncbi:MAG: hypothetical protein J0I34_02925 [Pseudonocardia sp.]|uniref:hypothetical protein n=1 Tax=unclassified Pseudonocardia TaxID=2619320 RepID=UPI001AC175E6|nr:MULTISPECIES: hypothetical protein [unclassified Pseudonocardia]MBN9107713.1 hypothetical protein [Pseudonocardia sp.]